MSVLLGTRSHLFDPYCPLYRSLATPIDHRYPIDVWSLQRVESEELDVVELKANLGREIVSALPDHFKKRNHGRFVAVTFTAKILAVSDTLLDLNEELSKKRLKENYYIERIGYSTITQIF